jgi:hypothetical protein
MANWNNINLLEDEDQWWKNAYALFLQHEPQQKILNHVELYMNGNDWNDHGFSYKTIIPMQGKFTGVSRRAILVVISRSRCMNMNHWNTLLKPLDDVPLDLSKSEKDFINCIVDLIYDNNGHPRPFAH